ncbi:hypothetical protein ACWIYZ_04755 [Ursidibacter arcticus]
MINEQDKQAFLNGAYGITGVGNKAKLVYKSSEQSDYPYLVVVFGKNGEHSYWVNNNLQDYANTKLIVGLWKDKPEPFDLEKALSGKPVMTKDGHKAFIKINLNNNNISADFPLIGYIDYGFATVTSANWTLEGEFVKNYADHPNNIIGMWQEPVSNTVTVTLPRALPEPKDGMWFIGVAGVDESCYGKNMNKQDWERTVYFGSKEDAQEWLNAMRNSRI